MPTLLLSLGSNLGLRATTLATACDLLALALGGEGIVSDCYESDPVGFASGHRFLNCAARFTCNLPLAEAFACCRQVERLLGRTQKSHGGHYADRPIDIDLLAWDDVKIDTPSLTLPHPRMTERAFVLLPLAEIAGGLRHAGTGQTYAELASRCDSTEAMRLPHTAPRPCRRLRADDVTPRLTAEINRLLAQLSPGRQPWQTEGLRTLLKEEALCLLALSNAEGRLTGMASLLTTPQLTGRKGHVEDVVVDAVHRGKGLGKRLMANTLAHAAAAGIQSLELTSRPARKAANALYRKMGFTLRETNTYQIKGDSLTRWTAVATAEKREQ